MSLFTKLGNDIASPVDAAGNKRSVDNGDMQVWMTEVERMSAAKAMGAITFGLLSEANSSLGYAPWTTAWIINDPVPANNGWYTKTGASGSGFWVRLGDLPYSYIRSANAGAGSANAIVATTTVPIPVADGGALVSLNITATNTGAPVTVSFNGGAALTIKTNTGVDPAVGGLTAGMVVAGYKVGSEFRLLSDQASTAIIAAAEAAADRAEAAAQSVVSRAWFKTVASLLGDNNVVIGYAGSGAQYEVEAGDPTEAGGHSYEVAASDATGNDIVATAGGVRLRLLPFGGWYYVDGLGAAGDASTSDQAAFINATDDYAVLQRFFDLCGQTGVPGLLSAKQYKTNTKLLINYNGTRIEGPGIRSCGIMWGGAFDDVVATASGSINTGIVLSNFAIRGGYYRAGTARYSFLAERWHRGCVIKQMEMREGLGIIKIVEGYYGTVDDLLLGPVVPNQTINGCTDAQWLEVNGPDSAAVYLCDWNAGRIGKLNCTTLAGEARATGNLAAEQTMIVSGNGAETGAWSIEATGVPYATYNARTQRLLKFTPNALLDVELYIEQVRSSLHALFFDRHAKVKIRKLFKYACDGAVFLRALTGAQVEIKDYRCYVVNYDILQSYAGTGTTPAGLSWSPFRWGRGVWAPGQWRTDVALPGTDRNVFDTAGQAIASGGTVRKLGPQDGNGSVKDQFFQGYRKVFPRKLTGMDVTSGSDGDGHYVQIAPGSMMAEDGGYRSLAIQSAVDPAILSYFRLRPDTASKWYRLWIGDAGQPYLTRHDADPVAAPEGDWIAGFQTDGANAIINLIDNPRLGYRGVYKQSSSTWCEIETNSTPPVLGYWRAGSEVRFPAAAGGAPGARCVTSGSPGTWKNHANLSG